MKIYISDIDIIQVSIEVKFCYNFYISHDYFSYCSQAALAT